MLAVTEALICGTKPTVSATHYATGLSTGSCTKALRFLTVEGLLTADAERGRNSARTVLLEEDTHVLCTEGSALISGDHTPILVNPCTRWSSMLAGSNHTL